MCSLDVFFHHQRIPDHPTNFLRERYFEWHDGLEGIVRSPAYCGFGRCNFFLLIGIAAFYTHLDRSPSLSWIDFARYLFFSGNGGGPVWGIGRHAGQSGTSM